MANRRPAGDGMVRQKKRGQWEGRITAGHKSDGKPIFRYVYGKTQKETLEKLHQRIEDYRGVELTEDSKMTLGEWILPNIYRPEEAMNPEYPYNRMKTLLKQAELPLIRFHDLRHTFAPHALTGGVDAKTLSRILGHTNASFTLDIYSHMTDTMQMQAVVNIDRKIGKTDAQMPEVEETPAPEMKSPVSPKFEPVERKIRKSGTGCVYQINDNLWEGSFFPRLPDGTRKKFNIYAKTREECEVLLAEMIKEKKAEIAAEKERLKSGREA